MELYTDSYGYSSIFGIEKHFHLLPCATIKRIIAPITIYFPKFTFQHRGLATHFLDPITRVISYAMIDK